MQLDYIPPQLITFGGSPGAGKDTVIARLAPLLGYEIVNPSNVIRADGLALAKKNNIHENEASAYFQEWRSQNPQYDKAFDANLAQLSGVTGKLVNARLGHHFIKGSTNILFTIDLTEAAKRRLANHLPGEKFMSIDEAAASLLRRQEKDVALYHALYGIENFLDPRRYNEVIDTSHSSIAEVTEKVLRVVSVPVPYEGLSVR